MFKSCTQNTLWPDIVFKCISACSVCAAADVIFVSSFMTFSISINSTERAETTLPYDGPRSCLRHVRCLVVPSRAVLNRHSVRSAWSFAQWPTLRRFLHRSQGSADCVHFLWFLPSLLLLPLPRRGYAITLVCLSVCLCAGFLLLFYYCLILYKLRSDSLILNEDDDYNNNNNPYWNQVDNRNLLPWHTKQAATHDSTALYNRTQSFGTQAFKSTKQNTSLARIVGSY